MKDLWAIVAVNDQYVIGSGSKIPWNCPEDLKRFKELTLNHPIIMGRKTFKSIGRRLPKRENIIITRNHSYKAEKCHVVHTLQEAIDLAHKLSDEVPFIIGGGEIYKQAMPLMTKIFMTLMLGEHKGNVYFPKPDFEVWKVIKVKSFSDHFYQELERREDSITLTGH